MCKGPEVAEEAKVVSKEQLSLKGGGVSLLSAAMAGAHE